jgi:hypothetical protein
MWGMCVYVCVWCGVCMCVCVWDLGCECVYVCVCSVECVCVWGQGVRGVYVCEYVWCVCACTHIEEDSKQRLH